MDDFLSISLLSLAMLIGCYVAGIIPLAVNFSEVRRKALNTCRPGGQKNAKSIGEQGLSSRGVKFSLLETDLEVGVL